MGLINRQRSGALPLRYNFAWNLFGSGVYALCQWAMVIVLAKMGSQEVVGRFAFGLSIAAPILMLSNLQLRQVQASDAINKYAFGDYFTVRWLTTSMALLVIAGVCFFARRGSYASWVLLVIGLAKAVESIGDVIHGLFQKHERMDIIAISM